jgi:hypothetical protein
LVYRIEPDHGRQTQGQQPDSCGPDRVPCSIRLRGLLVGVQMALDLYKMFTTKKPVRPNMYRGRVYHPEKNGWVFADGSGSFIADEVRQDELDGLHTLQQDNMDTARRMFKPSDFEARKRK